MRVSRNSICFITRDTIIFKNQLSTSIYNKEVDSFFILIIIAVILGNDCFECFDSAFYHIVGGFFYRESLQPHTGGGDDTRKEIIVSAREFYKFVANTHSNREQAEFND